MAGSTMRVFEDAFKLWLFGKDGPQKAQGLQSMIRASSELNNHIKAVRAGHPAYAFLWRGHWYLEQALVHNAQKQLEPVKSEILDAHNCFEWAIQAHDISVDADLPQSIRNASGTYRFLMGTNADNMFEPLLKELTRPR
ncbi:MAG: hypothetical protein P4L46_25490 [Fimbriimonas sp.]|nr:hypothetical protein [Fimbriimonas sp.]